MNSPHSSLPSALNKAIRSLGFVSGVIVGLTSAGSRLVAANASTPVITSISPDPGSPNDAPAGHAVTSLESFVIEGTADPNVTVEVAESGTFRATTQSDAAGFWEVNFSGTMTVAGPYRFTAAATNATGIKSPSSSVFTVYLTLRPSILQTVSNLKVGQAVDYNQRADVSSSMVDLTALAVTGLPPGLTFSEGRITGTPTTSGRYRIAIFAENGAGPSKVVFSTIVAPATTPPPPPPPTYSSWQSRPYGTGVTGTTTASENTITIGANGADIWGTSDAFRFVYRAVTGDCKIETEVTSLAATHDWAKAGIMIRESETAANARNVMVYLNPGGVFAVQQREAPGGVTTSLGKWWLYTRWIRLDRQANIFRAYSSPDGVNWTLRSTTTIAMNATVYVGFAVTAHSTTETQAVFTDPYIHD